MERGEQQRERNPISWAGFDGSRQLRNPISRLAAGTDRMDSDLWISRLAAAKRHFAVHHSQNSHLDRLSSDVFEAEEEEGQGRQDLPCPYCYEDHDVGSLCYHLEDEHGFESRVATDFRGFDNLQATNFRQACCGGSDLMCLYVSKFAEKGSRLAYMSSQPQNQPKPKVKRERGRPPIISKFPIGAGKHKDLVGYRWIKKKQQAFQM